MASTSAPSVTGATGRIKTAAATLYSENQSLIAEIRKALIVMREIAVDLEKDNKSQMVRDLEDAAVELLEASEDCTHLSSVIQSLGNEYQPGPEPTNFKRLFKDNISKLKSSSSSVAQSDPLLRQFRAAIWNVHHAGQPMPGEEQEDIIMTSTQSNLLNNICPLTGKPVTELENPVRSLDCKHIYEKKGLMHYIGSNARAQCPVAGCPKMVEKDRVTCDPLLSVEIEEMRAMSKQTVGRAVIEDFTEVYEETEES